MAKYSQANRPMRTVCPSLGADDLLLVGFNGEEAVSSPGGFTLELQSEKPSIAAKDLLRKPMGVELHLADGSTRYVQGLVRRFTVIGQDDDLTRYRAEIVPWLWFLSLSTDCRIFQNMSVLEIVEQVFKDQKFTDFESRCLKSYPKREYCVQYRESHLNFVSRLMEDEGIFYFFEHTASKHTLVLADNPGKFLPCPGLKTVTLAPPNSGPAAKDLLTGVQLEDQAATGIVTYNDYNPLTPKAVLLKTAKGKGAEELYEYPGGYETPDEGDRYAGLTLEEFDASHRVLYGTGMVMAFTAGHKFTLAEHSRSDFNTSWTLIRVVHSGHNADYQTGGGGGDYSYNNSFVGIPASVTFRPPSVTPRPRVRGAQTATVVGKAGEEIWCDKYGRVKVQFHWDRKGKKDENSSCWVRVATPWAGKNWGMIAIPRMGMEVMVDFLEGDPDQPIIAGMVYNAEQMPPYGLPANGTQTGILTRSAKGGAAANANEFRFEDKKGSEQVYLHAEKDLLTEVENDETRTVDHDRTTTIKNNETKTVKEGDEKHTLEKGSQTVKIFKDQSITLETGNQTTKIQKGNQETTLDMGNQTTTLKMGNQSTRLDLGNVETKLGLGNITMKCDAGAVAIEALQGIELKVGPSSIKIDMSGITITGLMVKAEGQVQTSIKAGAMCQVDGGAMLMAKGAITMIG
jgi:type VI secretion system secreted protein VgrG